MLMTQEYHTILIGALSMPLKNESQLYKSYDAMSLGAGMLRYLGPADVNAGLHLL